MKKLLFNLFANTMTIVLIFCYCLIVVGGEDAELFRNRKGYFSLNTQVTCNSNLEITDIVARWQGSVHDSTIFNNSRLRANFENGTYNGLLLGDSAYPLKQYLLTPLLNPQTAAEQLYNESHIRTRNIIERLFGIWKRRFPILALGMRYHLHRVMTIIVATAVLHNIARRNNEAEPDIDPDLNLPMPWDQMLTENNVNNIINNNEVIDVTSRIELIHNYFATYVKFLSINYTGTQKKNVRTHRPDHSFYMYFETLKPFP